MIIRKARNFIKAILLYKIFRYWILLGLVSNKIKPAILRYCGARVGRNVYFGNGVYIDNNAHLLHIEDNVIIAPNVQLLFHMRNMKDYTRNTINYNLKHVRLQTKVCKGASIGMGSLILPGVTIGEGAVIGAGTVVNKDVPAWSLAVGNPMKIIKEY